MVNVSVPHKLGSEEAKKRIEYLITDAKARFGGQVTDVQETWVGDTNNFKFKAMGFAVAGKLQVKSESADVEMNLPFAALPFKGRIESTIAEQARTLLA